MTSEIDLHTAPEGNIPFFCCPHCLQAGSLFQAGEPESGRVRIHCQCCSHAYSRDAGIFDFLGTDVRDEVITPFQRLMQCGPVTAIYEKAWRPTGFFIASSTSFRQFSSRLIEWVSPASRSSILDLACGPGLFTVPLAQRAAGQVVGVDLSRPMLRRSRQLLLAQGCKALLARASAFRLPFPDSIFDAILCSGALHLFDRPEAALREISRTLRTGGDFICQTTLKPRHSAGLATILDKIIRFGFFSSVAAVDTMVGSVGLEVDLRWQQRIIYLFRARKL